jgi:hypothetical protein
MSNRQLVRFEEVTPTLLPVAYFDGHLADLISHLKLPIYGGYNDLDEMNFSFLTLPSGNTVVVGEYSNAPRTGVDLYVDSKQVDIPAVVYESCQQLGKSRNQVVWFSEKFQAEIDKLFMEQGDIQEIERSKFGIQEVIYNPIVCFQHSLKIYDRAGFPEYWAMLQYNLGTSYYNAFKSGDGDQCQNLKLSIYCYYQSLEVYTGDRFPERWEISQKSILASQKSLLEVENSLLTHAYSASRIEHQFANILLSNNRIQRMYNRSGNRSDFIHHRRRYFSIGQPQNLVFNDNLREFAERVGYISSLETEGRLTPEDFYHRIEKLWQELKNSKKQLKIGEKPFQNSD